MMQAVRKPGAHERADDRRDHILQAALECFTSLGYARTTLAHVRERSGASTGSIYHHFRSKEGLIAALYLRGIASYQEGLLEALRPRRTARTGILAIVRYHLGWVQDNPAWAQLLVQMRHEPSVVAQEPAIEELNRKFLVAVEAWFKPHIEKGRLRALPTELYSSLIMGPCREYARRWIAGQFKAAPKDVAQELGNAAWAVVRGTGVDDA